MKDEICDVVLRRGGFIDEHDVLALKFVDIARRGIDRQRRAGDNQKIRPADGVKRADHRIGIKRLLVEHDVGLDAPAAAAAGRNAAQRKKIIKPIKGSEKIAEILDIILDGVLYDAPPSDWKGTFLK